jgi:hypothetical protein
MRNEVPKLPTEMERARNDISKLLNGYLAHKISKRDAMQVVDSVLQKVWELGYDEAYEEWSNADQDE